jgi:4-hydroxy-tetrahydrodipicolinate reductase
MGHRVVQWGTGNVGLLALRAIIDHPDLELAGLVVHSPAKVGVDAGELCGTEPVGVVATDDPEVALAGEVDCVCYTATGDLRPDAAVADMAAVLARGINVVSTSVVSLVHPGSADRRLVEPLEKACAAGGSSCFTSGIDPGFANDLVPLTLFGVCQRIDAVRIMEVLDYSTYMQPQVLFETMGFGQALDSAPLLLLPGVLTLAWGGTVGLLADGLGVTLDGIEEWFEREPAERTYDLEVGTIPEGTQAGLRFEVRGMVGGVPRIVVEHVTRMHPSVAPRWPTMPGQGGYHIAIDGNPSISADLVLVGEDGDHNTGGVLATATRVLNAIPAVVAARPGLLSTLDLPLVTGRGLMRDAG